MPIHETFPANDLESINNATQTRDSYIGYCLLLGTTEHMYTRYELDTLYAFLQVVGQKFACSSIPEEHLAQVIPLDWNKREAL